MAKIKSFFKDVSIRKCFVIYVSITIFVVIILSVVTVFACLIVQRTLLPEKEKAVLSISARAEDGGEKQNISMVLTPGEELPFLISSESGSTGKEFVSYTFDKIENSYRSLSPKRQVVYVAASAAMVVMPAIYCIVGILICAYMFYRRKLKGPLNILEDATAQIKQQNLDFEIKYDSEDELGKLCTSFEDMRYALLQANLDMWNMLEERRNLQASIAHDLRNPIAVIKGYAEYLQINLANENISTNQIAQIADNLYSSAERLESYTDSVRNISNLEALEIKRQSCRLDEFIERVYSDMCILAGKSNITLSVNKNNLDGEFKIDTESYSRVLENLFQNALRYAENTILLQWSVEENNLITTIDDDGPGFPNKILKQKRHTILHGDGEHIGMGLTVSEILCHKHGGKLKVSNKEDGGAVAEFTFNIK